MLKGGNCAADPDEYANFVNNAAYSTFPPFPTKTLRPRVDFGHGCAANAGIAVVLKEAIELAGVLNISVPSNWSSIAANITVLSDPTSGIILEYDGFNGSTAVKQADVVASRHRTVM